MTVGALIDGRFRLEALAGSGGMGAVYKARDEETGAMVALKLLHPHAFPEAARLAREAQALAALQHPNIVRYVAHGSLDVGLPYLAMEWLEGEDLHTRLDRGPLPISEAITLGIAVAGALHAAHRVGLVHRDIKPSNLLLLSGGDPGSVKVLDFGIVRWHGRVITATGAAFGTPGYMAPEQARSAGRVDARADVFSLGCVLFEAVSGVPVFAGEDIIAVLTKVMLEPAPPLSEALPGAPAALEDLIAKMLEKEPDARPVDAGAVRAALAALEVLPGPPSMAPSRRRRVVTEVERRVVSLVLARRRAASPAGGTLVMQPALDPLRAAVWPYGERVEMLADGSVLVVPVTTGSARDQANQAARCALALRAALPSWSISVGSGRADSAGTGSLGDAIDRASRSLGVPDAIHIDEVTSAFLDARFEVTSQAGGPLVLVGEHAQAERVRTVLGKPTPCVGRERDLAALAGYLDECLAQRRARPVLVTGQAGIGKSRLRAEFLGEARARIPAVEVWMARGDPVSEGSPYAMIASVIRRAAGIEGAPRDVAREKLRALVARHVPEGQRTNVVEFLGELTDVPTEGEGSIQLRAARRDPALMGDRIASALSDLFVAESAAHPLLLVLEDLHWGDIPSVKAIDTVLRAARELPLMVLALARPEVHDSFPRLWSARSLATLPLSELGDTAGRELVRAVLGDSITSAAARRLVERSSGNPFFLEELIRVAARGDADVSSLPETVLGVVEGRLEELSQPARRILRAASVFGLVFWSGAVGPLLGTATDGATMAELLDREVIQQRREARFPKEVEYAFQHALLREAAYSTLPEDDRVAGHKLAAEWLEAAGEHDSAVLAAHFEGGRELERARAHYERAAAHALEGNDFAAVHARVGRAVACGASGQLLGKLRVLEARARMWSGEMEPALQAAEAALLALSEGTPPWYDALWLIATTSVCVGNPARVEEVALLVGHDMPEEAASAWFSGCCMIAINLLFGDRVASAGRLLDCLERVPAAFLDQDVVSRAQLNVLRAIWVQHAGDLGARTTLLRQAIADFDLLGAIRPATLQRVGLAWAYLDLGAFAEAEALSKQILATAEQAALVHVERGARYCMGRALTHTGRLAEARALLEEAAAAFEAGGDQRLAGAAMIALVDPCLLAGDLDAAAVAAEKAAALVEQLPPFLAQALAMRAEVLLRQGRAAEALSYAQEAVAPLHLGQHAVQGEARIHLVYAEALRATGAAEAARVEIGKARDALEARAEKIANADWRRSFLEALPENARTLELARSWLAE